MGEEQKAPRRFSPSTAERLAIEALLQQRRAVDQTLASVLTEAAARCGVKSVELDPGGGFREVV